MAKLPWMKFFPTDYLADTRGLSPSDKGIWMDLICFAWDSPKRGQISADKDTFCRMLGCSMEELNHSFVTFMSRGVCQVSENGHGDVTVISRRMSREEKERESARLRKQREREKENVTVQSRECPPDMPEAICQKPEAIKELRGLLITKEEQKNGAFSEKPQEENRFKETFKQIEKLRFILSANGTWNKAPAWAQMKIQLKYHPEAILLALQRVNEKKPSAPEPYADQILLVESQNYNEREHTEKSKEFKKMGNVGEILNNVMKEVNK